MGDFAEEALAAASADSAAFAAERDALLTEGNRLLDAARDRDRAADEGAAGRERRDRLRALTARYEELLPEVPVARCPESGALVRWPIDTVGLDGWFWRYQMPARRTPGDLPPAWRGMTGAMRLVPPVERTPHTAVPGPGVPFVVPAILRRRGIQAVVAQVPVGRHTGWAITYFGPRPRGVHMVNLWGKNDHPVYDGRGRWLGWGRDLYTVDDYDFALAEWVRSGKLLWMAPGDGSATLREGLDGCPFLDLPGPREIAMVGGGEVRRVASPPGRPYA